MLTGKVKTFKSDLGYGFIKGDDGKDVFVHWTGIAKQGFKSLEEGQAVSYEVKDGDKGPIAVNVTVI